MGCGFSPVPTTLSAFMPAPWGLVIHAVNQQRSGGAPRAGLRSAEEAAGRSFATLLAMGRVASGTDMLGRRGIRIGSVI
eukprot:3283281-Heterocapsa_arctica.AAC.1